MTDSTIANRLSSRGVEVRLSYFATAWEQISEAPILGYGGYVVADRSAGMVVVHNTYLQQFIYFGIPMGLVVGFSLIAIMFRFMNWYQGGYMSTYLANAVGFSILVENLIFLSETSFEASVLRVMFYFQIGMLVALLSSLRETTISQRYAKNTEGSEPGGLKEPVRHSV